MDKNFHYYAIKVLACHADFNAADAQKIAEYSQFVDDFYPFRVIRVKKSKVPDCAKHLLLNPEVLAIERSNGVEMSIRLNSLLHVDEINGFNNEDDAWFDPVNTGFGGLKYAFLILNEKQRQVVVPFHFIPSDSLRVFKERDVARYQVSPFQLNCNDGNNNNLLYSLLLQHLNSRHQPLDLIKTGILLHIFADTYSHQRFSGFFDTDNEVVDVEEINNATKNLRPILLAEDTLPVPIGHAFAGTTPDLTNVTWKARKPTEGHFHPYERNNTEEFLIVARDILDYLRFLNRKPRLEEGKWKEVEGRIKNAFLHMNWADEFPNIVFEYEKGRIEDYESEDFFRFNVVAEYIKQVVMGEVRIESCFPTSICSRLPSCVRSLLLTKKS